MPASPFAVFDSYSLPVYTQPQGCHSPLLSDSVNSPTNGIEPWWTCMVSSQDLACHTTRLSSLGHVPVPVHRLFFKHSCNETNPQLCHHCGWFVWYHVMSLAFNYTLSSTGSASVVLVSVWCSELNPSVSIELSVKIAQFVQSFCGLMFAKPCGWSTQLRGFWCIFSVTDTPHCLQWTGNTSRSIPDSI